MAIVNIAALTSKDNKGIQAAQLPPLLSENLTSSGVSLQSSAVPQGTEIVRIATDGAVRIAVGTNPTADQNGVRLLANTVNYFTVDYDVKVAVIDEV